MQRKTISDYQKLARSKGFTWVGDTEPRSVLDDTLWQCGNGHVWHSRYQHIKAGKGCPYCYGNARKSPEDYRALAERHGLIWRQDLWGEIGNVNEPMLWELPSGRIFVDTYHNLYIKNSKMVVADYPHYSLRREVTDEEIANGEWKNKWKNKRRKPKG